MNKKILFVIVSIFLYLNFGYSQNQAKIDSLILQLDNLQEDTNKVNTLNKISFLYSMVDYHKTIEYAESAIVLGEKLDFNDGLVESYKYLGTAYTKLGDYIIGLEKLKVAIKLSEKSSNPYKLASTYNRMLFFYSALEDYNKAAEYAFLAFEVVEKLNISGDISDAAFIRYKLNYEKGNFKTACDNYIIYKQMRDSVFNEENFANISNMEIRYNIQKLEKELDLAEKEKQKR